jgi:hypothetical protein
MVSASKFTAAYRAMCRAGYQAVLPKAAAWTSRKLSAAIVLGLALLALLPEMPPFLAAAPAAPVEMVRTVRVPYLDPAPPGDAASPRPSGRERPASILQVVAQRSRARHHARREPDSGALGKGGAGGSGEKAAASVSAAPDGKGNAKKGDAEKGDAGKADPKADSKAAAPADARPAQSADPKAASKAEPPEPEGWSDPEVVAALRECLRRLAPLGVEIEVAEPVRQERCGAPAPVMLKRLGPGAARIELQPPAMLNCAMVASLHAWAEKTLQPAAQEVLGSPIVRMRHVSGYVCRNRVGTTFHPDRLSEHALANAIDISSFVTADGRAVDVLGQWGPTARELREQQEKAWEAVQDAKGAVKEADKQAAEASRAARTARGPKQADAKAEAERAKEEAERKKENAQQKEAEWRRILARAAGLQKLGRGEGGQNARPQRGDSKKADDARGPPAATRTADAKGTIPVPAGKDGESLPAESVFLRRLHRGACGTFGTVLGPDANEAHRNHFHFDLAARKRSAFCE